MVDREREKVVYTEGRSGGSTALVAVVAIIAILLILYFLFGSSLLGGGDTKEIKADVDISAPSGGGSGQ